MCQTTSKQGKLSASRRGIFSATALSALLLGGQAAPLLANPTGGQVVAGAATIGPAGKTLTINQSTGSAIINWQQFSISGGETTKFILPNSGSATLNRVVGGDLSSIYGSLQSNGHLYLINPAGIVVGATGRIDTAGFVGSTLDVSNDEFLKGGNLHFTGSSDAGVDNAGVIHASDGDVYLIASQVNNTGTLSAPQGNVGLAAGNDVLFQQAGDQHLFVQSTGTGTTRATGVTNSGTIRAAAAELRAAGGNAYALAINNSGQIAASGYKKINGQVFLTADGGNISNIGSISAKTTSGNGGTIVLNGHGTTSSGQVLNSGKLVASGTATGTKGGTVEVLGNQVGITGSGLVDVSGNAGGGTALIGGDEHGANAAIPDASQTYLGPQASINASATTSGNGGKVILWGNQTTQVYGQISARGGAEGGNGGFVETSAATLDVRTPVDTSAPKGQAGTWLLDPTTVSISDTESNSGYSSTPSAFTLTSSTVTISDAALFSALQTGNVVIDANGTITWSQSDSPYVYSGINDKTLTLEATGQISLSNLNLAPALGANFNLVLNPSLTGAGNVAVIGDTINLGGGTFTAFGNGTTLGSEGVQMTSSTLDAGSVALTGVSAIGTSNNYGIFLGTDNIQTSGGITLTGTGTGTGSDNKGIQDMASTIESTVGNISMVGTSTLAGVDDNTGIALYGTTIQTGGTGTVSLHGTSPGDSTGSYDAGLQLIQTVSITTAEGSITLFGSRGSASTSGESGVDINPQGDGVAANSDTITIQSSGGSIAITGSSSGTVGSGNNGIDIAGTTIDEEGNGAITLLGTAADGTGSNDGIEILSSSIVETAGSGLLTITGTAGAGQNNDVGVYVDGTGTMINSAAGLLTITGYSSSGGVTGSGNNGILIDGGAQITGGSGGIQITGTAPDGGTNSNIGVEIDGFNGAQTVVNDAGGNITITGSGGSGYDDGGVPAGTDLPDYGVAIADNVVLTTTGSGAITLVGKGGSYESTSDSYGVLVADLNDSTLDTSDDTPSVTSAGAFVATDEATTGTFINAGINAVSFTAQGSGGVSGPVDINTSTIMLAGGNFTVIGVGNSLDIDGVDIISSSIDAGGGSYTIKGTATYGPDPDLGGNESGVGVNVIEGSSLMTEGAGTISITGDASTGIEADNSVQGIDIDNSTLMTANGKISLTGTVGDLLGVPTSSSSDIEAVIVGDSSSITATNGQIVISGTSSPDTSAVLNVGVFISVSSITEGGSAPLTITGKAGQVISGEPPYPDDNYIYSAESAGLYLTNDVEISSTGSGAINLSGGGGANMAGPGGGGGGGSAIVFFGEGGGGGGVSRGIDFGESEGEVSIMSAGGGVSLTGTAGSGSGTSNNIGLDIIGATIQDTGNGAVTLMGTGGSGQDDNEGVYLEFSNISTGGGLLTIDGMGNSGGVTGEINVGVDIEAYTEITSGSGGIHITGKTPTGGTDYNDGIDLFTAISTTGGGDIVLNGTANGSGIYNAGIYASSISVTSDTGSISLTGASGGGGSDNNTGLSLYAITIQTGGTGTITLQGTSTGGTDYLDEGVEITSASEIFTDQGNITISGSTGSTPNGGIGVEIDPEDGSTLFIESNTGSVSIAGAGGSGNTGPIDDDNPYRTNDGVYISDAVNISGNNLSFAGAGSGYEANGIYLAPIAGGTAPSLNASGTLSVNSESGQLIYAPNVSAASLAFSTPAGTSLNLSNPGENLALGGGGDFTITEGEGSVDISSASVGQLNLQASSIVLGSVYATSGVNLDLEDGGNVTQNGPLITPSLTIANAGQVTLDNLYNNISALGAITFNGGLNIYTDPGLVINGLITGSGPVVIQSINNNLTIGPDGSISTSGGNVNLVTNRYFINDSSEGANAVDVAGGNYYIYSHDPSQTQLAGLGSDFTQYGASYPAGTGTGNGVIYAQSTASDQNTQSQITPQTSQVAPQQPNDTDDTDTDASGISYTGSGGLIQTVSLTGNLADSTGSGANIGSGDVAQLDNNGLSNVNDPHATGALGQALSGTVMDTLGDAMQQFGDPNYNSGSPNNSPGDEELPGKGKKSVQNGNTGAPSTNETILKSGDVVQMGASGGGVQNVPLSQAPQPLQDALSNGVMDNLKGH